jgi:hypothetical protein
MEGDYKRRATNLSFVAFFRFKNLAGGLMKVIEI